MKSKCDPRKSRVNDDYSQKKNNLIQEIFIDHVFCVRFFAKYYVPRWSLEPSGENSCLTNELSVKEG